MFKMYVYVKFTFIMKYLYNFFVCIFMSTQIFFVVYQMKKEMLSGPYFIQT